MGKDSGRAAQPSNSHVMHVLSSPSLITLTSLETILYKFFIFGNWRIGFLIYGLVCLNGKYTLCKLSILK